MKISVVTVVKNGEKFLRECLLSVLGQEADVHLQYLVVDGGSDDSSRQIVEETDDLVKKGYLGTGLLSVDFLPFFNNDRSMYDGLAFGMERVSGDAILYINSDDILQHNALYHIQQVFSNFTEVKWVSGYANQVNASGRIFYKKLPWKYRHDFIRRGLYGRKLPFIQQESCFWRREMHDAIDWQVFREFKLAGDQYLWIRFAEKTELHVLPELIGSHRTHGDQLSHKHRTAYYAEYDQIVLTHGEVEDIQPFSLKVLQDRLLWILPDVLKRSMNKLYLKIP